MLDFKLSTFIFQVVNFFLLLVCLTWFLYRPLLKVMKKREADIAAKLRDADERTTKADDERRQLAEELYKAKAQAEELLTAARVEAVAMREQLLKQARTEAAQLLEGARQQLQERELAAQQRVQTQIGKTAVAMTRELARHAIGPTLHQELVQRFVGNDMGLETQHTELLLQALSKTDGKVTVELAYPPSEAQQDQLRTALAHTLKEAHGAVTLDFRVEPALVAGLRLLVGTVAVDLSLSRTLEELRKKVRPGGAT